MKKSAGFGIHVKKERECGIRTPPSRPCAGCKKNLPIGQNILQTTKGNLSLIDLNYPINNDIIRADMK